MADKPKTSKKTKEKQKETEKEIKTTETKKEELIPKADTQIIETKSKTEPLEPPIEKTEPIAEEPSEQEKQPIKESIKEEKTEVKPVEKPEDTEEKTKKKDEKDKDFKYIVRIANTDVDGNKNVVYGLASVKGIGLNLAILITDKANIDRYTKIGDLNDKQIDKIKDTIENVKNNAPTWMLNHRKDSESGSDIHLIDTDIDMRLREEINIMKKIRSYRGIRHERGLPVRGQRTRANNRKGLALGVSKKREPTTATTENK